MTGCFPGIVGAESWNVGRSENLAHATRARQGVGAESGHYCTSVRIKTPANEHRSDLK
jgi:hypothetical protein